MAPAHVPSLSLVCHRARERPGCSDELSWAGGCVAKTRGGEKSTWKGKGTAVRAAPWGKAVSFEVTCIKASVGRKAEAKLENCPTCLNAAL